MIYWTNVERDYINIYGSMRKIRLDPLASKFTIPFILLMLCACLLFGVIQVSTVSGAGAGGGSGGETGDGTGQVAPPHGGIGLPSGSFTLNRGIKGQDGQTCAYYTDFLLVVNSGQQFKARLWTSGATINYTVVSEKVFNSLQQIGCSYLSQLSSQVQSFNSPTTLNWTAPQTGQYELVFYSQTNFSGQIYCLPQS